MVENLLWKNSFQEAFKKSEDLWNYLQWEREDLSSAEKSFPLFIPRRLAAKIKQLGPTSSLAKEFLPDVREVGLLQTQMGLLDPIGDKVHLKAPQLIHRYETRALFTPTSICPVHCRFCFRRNELSPKEDLFTAEFDQTLNYLKNHPEIREIIFTGGDPLTLTNEKIEKYLNDFSKIPTIRDIRFHTRYPVILPERIDEGLLGILRQFSKKFRTISIAIHANHADEFDEVSMKAILSLGQVNIQLLSQTVLLKDVNDSVDSLLDLINIFIELKIRPYYLHHPDQVKGGLHFYLPIENGRRIYAQLRDNLPGWAIPQYIIDIPGGSGKVSAFNPETFNFSGQMLAKDGHFIRYEEPDSFSF